MAFSIDGISSVANGTPVSVVIPVNTADEYEVISVAVKYAAVAGTSGVAVSLSYSPDGSAYTASGAVGATIAPAATVLGTAFINYSIGEIALRKDPLPINFIKVTLTNADATNAALCAVAHEVKGHA